MKKNDKTKENKITKILEDLNSTDSKKVTKAVKSLEAHGDVSFIKPLADKLMAGVSEKNKTEKGKPENEHLEKHNVEQAKSYTCKLLMDST